MSNRDLTPDEARAEVKAFMGEGWVVDAHAANDPCLGGVRVWLHSSGALVSLHSDATTLRAAVSALKSAWRDAVRPWMEAAIEAKLDTADVDGYAPDEVVIARVLKEDQ